MSRTRKKRSHPKYSSYKHSDLKKRANQFTPKPTLSYSLSQEITQDKSPVVKRNSFGDVIYSMQYIGYEKFEYWIEYDEDRRPLSYIDTRGCSWKCKYNSKGNICDYWDYSGYQESYRYYKNNLVICTNSFGNKIKKKVITNKYVTRDLFISTDDYI